MSERMPELQLSEETLQQIADLAGWLGNEHATRVVQEALSQIWQVESERRRTGAKTPWVVQPGLREFPNQDAAHKWLAGQGAQPETPDKCTWATYDGDKIQTLWYAEPLVIVNAA